MASRGQKSKDFIMETILQTFPTAFIDGKNIRIPMQEENSKGIVETIEIKVALTAAKDVIGNGQVSPEAQQIIDFEQAPTDAEIEEMKDVLSSF